MHTSSLMCSCGTVYSARSTDLGGGKTGQLPQAPLPWGAKCKNILFYNFILHT